MFKKSYRFRFISFSQFYNFFQDGGFDKWVMQQWYTLKSYCSVPITAYLDSF